MPSCDGSNCGACSYVDVETTENNKKLKEELRKTKRHLSKVISENNELHKILRSHKNEKIKQTKRKKC